MSCRWSGGDRYNNEFDFPTIRSTVFPNTALYSQYWSSSTRDGSRQPSAWNVSFRDGSVSYSNQRVSLYVRCVSGSRLTEWQAMDDLLIGLSRSSAGESLQTESTGNIQHWSRNSMVSLRIRHFPAALNRMFSPEVGWNLIPEKEWNSHRGRFHKR